jgi:NAD(P)-dependent dehydrogenase (short-subunit alcohol dehydrogenase family)
MEGRLAGRVAVVTGAGSGIGRATVRRFAAEGARVVAVDVDEKSGQPAADEVGGTFIACDVADEGQVAALFTEVDDVLGRVDIAFNNAGIAAPDDESILTTRPRGVGTGAAHQPDVGLSLLQVRDPVHATAGQGFDHQHGQYCRPDGSRDLPDRLHRQ